MPPALPERTVVLSFDNDEWAALETEARERGLEVHEVVRRAAKQVADERVVIAALDPPAGHHTLDGDIADRVGNDTLLRACRRSGITFSVVGGTYHDGKLFDPRHSAPLGGV